MKEGVYFHMSMSSQDWQTIKAKIAEMEQVIEALRRLRDGHIAFPDSVFGAIDNAIRDSEKRVRELKDAMVD